MNRKHLFILLVASFALVLTLGALGGCGAPPKLPTPTLVAQRPATHTPTPEPTATPTHTPTPQPTHTPTPTSAPSAQASAGAASKAKAPVASATPEKLVMIVTEAEANKMAVEALSGQQDVQIDNPKVDFRPDEMYVSGDTVVGFFKVNIGVLAMVEAVDGKPKVIVKEIYVNNDRATGFLRNQIESMIAPHLDKLAMVSDDFYVEKITITEDKMVITGHYR